MLKNKEIFHFSFEIFHFSLTELRAEAVSQPQESLEEML